MWKPLHLQPVYGECERVGGAVAERLFSQGLCLPSGSAMDEADLQRVIRTVRSAFPNSRPWKAPRDSAAIRGDGRRRSSWTSWRGSFVAESWWGHAGCWSGATTSSGSAAASGSAAILAVYVVELTAVFYLSYGLRWDFAVPDDFRRQLAVLIIPVVLCKLVLLGSFGQFRSVMSYFGLTDFGGSFFPSAPFPR